MSDNSINARAGWVWRGVSLGLLGFCTWFAQGLAADIKDTRERVLQLQSAMPEIAARINTRIDHHALRLKESDRRNERQDTDIGDIQKLLYPMQRPLTPEGKGR